MSPSKKKKRNPLDGIGNDPTYKVKKQITIEQEHAIQEA